MKNIVVWGVLLFVIIAFFRLITLEITEDGYHTDLPRLYFTTGTTMHETKDFLQVIPYPQLPEMIYLIPVFLDDKEAARFIHFGFYLLIILMLFQITKESKYIFAKYAPLIFVTTPLVIRYSSSQYTDFFMLFCFLLSMILIKKNISIKQTVLSGILWGAVLSAKMWMLIYMPMVFLYIFILQREQKLVKASKAIIVFVLSAFLVVSLWYLRSFILTGNPIFPIYTKQERVEIANESIISVNYSYFGLNTELLNPATLIVFSPLFFLGVVFSAIYYKDVFKRIKTIPLFVIFLLLTLEEIFVKIYFGRYLLGWYTIFSIIAATGILLAVTKQKIFKLILVSTYCIVFLYYFANTILIVPYGFGWADQNSYLSRVLGRDNVSYYDFDHLFNKHISKNDLVASYGIGSFYYADFSYIDVGYIFGKDKRSFDLIKEKKITKLFIKGGNFDWFCKQLGLTNCDSEKVKLLATYPADLKKYNLYLIQY